MADSQISLYTKNLKILFWNTRSFTQRQAELRTKLHEFDMCVCVETWLTEKDQVQVSGFVTYRSDRKHSRGGGIIILIRKNLAFVEINDIHSPDISVELCGIHLNNIIPATDLFVCYRTPGHSLAQDQWDQIVNNIKLNNHSILLGDFNAHHTFWNCNYTDGNGSKFFNSIGNRDLYIHNQNTLTHVDFYRNSKSNIDLVLSTLNTSDKINVCASDET